MIVHSFTIPAIARSYKYTGASARQTLDIGRLTTATSNRAREFQLFNCPRPKAAPLSAQPGHRGGGVAPTNVPLPSVISDRDGERVMTEVLEGGLPVDPLKH
jgi:hypothetical protein